MAGEAEGDAPPDARNRPPAQPATVLVVDDSMIPRLALARGVEREGHRVLQATDGREALAVLRAEPVDMVLLDLVMPEVDGFQVLAEMRADAALHEIPVLVVSAVEATADVVRAIGMGAIDCLPKPFEPALLRVRLGTALERLRLRRLEQDYLRQELALRQQERLATLGRLSAGLGHELNNPAAATLSTARQLGEALTIADTLLPRLLSDPSGRALVEAVSGVLARPADGTPGHERVDELESVLSERIPAEAWTVADELAEGGLSAADVDRVLSTTADAALALDWLRVRLRVRRALQRITSSVGRMTELTSALRGYSYLDQAPQQDVDVRRGLDDTLTILAHKLPEGVRVQREYDAGLPTIHGYGGQLNQVWTNLLDNAIDAAGPAGTLVVRARAEEHDVVVQVEDDGPGIPPELVGRVFDPFVTTKPPGEGTGLGLNISHQIVTDVHGGQLTVQSRPGRTVFTVRLPPTVKESST
jgi:signal transduction histidine kinase